MNAARNRHETSRGKRIDPSRARRRLLGAQVGLALASTWLPAWAEESLTHVVDLRATLAEARREAVPLLLFFSAAGCPFCAEVRQGYLKPRVAMGARAGVIVREIDITSARRFVDQGGTGATESAFAARMGVRMAPTVVLVDHDMRSLGDPLVGIGAAGFYEAYLQGAIDTARQRLAAGG